MSEPSRRIREYGLPSRVARALYLSAGCSLLVAACATTPPENVENICAIFEEKRGWYKAAKKSEKRWAQQGGALYDEGI